MRTRIHNAGPIEPRLKEVTKVAASITHRKWGVRLSRVVDREDFEQQAVEFYLKGLGDPPPDLAHPDGLRVWEIGRLLSRLDAWCQKLFRRSSREEVLGTDPPDHRALSPQRGDVWDTVNSLCTPDECTILYFHIFGYTGGEAQEILGISETAYRQRLHRLRHKLRASASLAVAA